MTYLVVVFLIAVLVIGLAVLAVIRGYDVELAFHPPILVKVKLTNVSSACPPIGSAERGK
jgi:hypothetical protein